MSQDDMVKQWKCGKETVNSYLKQLEDMKLIYVYRHKKRRSDGTYHKLNNSYGRYADKDVIIEAAQKYADTVECEDDLTKIDRRSIKLRYNAFCEGAKKYQGNPAAILTLYKECKRYNKSLEYRPIESMSNGEYKQGEPLDLAVFPDNVINITDSQNRELVHNDEWGEPDPMTQKFNIEEMLDMPASNMIETV